MSLSTLQLTDGTTTLSLVSSGVFLAEDGWAPAIAERNLTEVGQPYDPVEETIEINIAPDPASTATTTATLRTLMHFKDQVLRWSRDDPSAPAVQLQAAITGSSVGTLTAPVIAFEIELPNNYLNQLFLGSLDGVTLRLTRLGLWMTTAFETEVTSSAVTNGSKMTATFASSNPLPCPVRLEMDWRDSAGTTFPSNNILWPSVLLVANDTDHIQAINASTFATGAPATWTSVADAANFPPGGNKLRYTPAATTAVESGRVTQAIGNTLNEGKQLAVFVTCRASVANNFRVRINAARYVVPTTFPFYSNPKVVDTTATTILRFDFAQPNRVGGSVNLAIEVTAAVATGTIEFGNVIVMNVGPEADPVVIAYLENPFNEAVFNGSTSTWALLADPRTKDSPTPIAGVIDISGVAGDQAVARQGSPEIWIRGDDIAALWLGYGDGTAATLGSYWAYAHPGGGYAIKTRLRAKRRSTYLTLI